MSENTYVITDDATGLKAVVDPGYFGEDVMQEIQNAADLRYILLTHGHYDHFAAVREYLDTYTDAVFAVPEEETHLLHGGRDNKWMALGHGNGVCPEAEVKLSEGDNISLGETVLRVIGTPGHTEGGICFATDREVFTGDTLFRLSVGNSSLETGDWDTMVRSIRDKIYALDDDLIVWPGHGPATTIGYEKSNNPYVQGIRYLVPAGTTSIGSKAYYGRTDLTEAVIPDSVREIGAGAFAGCTSLRTVVLPEGLERIRKDVFAGCTSLRAIDIPPGVTGIGEWAFRNCLSLEQVKIPASVTDIAAEAFMSCPVLTMIAEPGSYAEGYARKFNISLAL